MIVQIWRKSNQMKGIATIVAIPLFDLISYYYLRKILLLSKIDFA